MNNLAASTQSQNISTVRNISGRAFSIDMRNTLRGMSGSELLWIKASSNARTGELVDQEPDRRSFVATAQRSSYTASIDLEPLRKALERLRESSPLAAAV